MNKLVSGAIGVAIELTSNKIYLPDILDLKGKRIKHIDFCDSVSETESGQSCTDASSFSVFLNIQEQNTKELKVKSLSLEMLRVSRNKGNRLFINKIIDFPNSFLEVQTSMPGKHIFLVFWFDEPKIMNRVLETGKSAVDSFEVITTSAGNKKFYFGENRTLYNKKFQNILFYLPYSQGVTPKGNISVARNLAYSSFVTLQKENYQYLRNVPVYLFDQQNVTFPIRLQNVMFDFTNSFITIAPDSAVTPGESFLFNVEFDDNE